MSMNCLEGYLTPGCEFCPDWADGTDDRGIGCACRFPIMWCSHFAKAYEEERNRYRRCYHCNSYQKETKRCKRTGNYTARKNTCKDFL